MHPADKDNPNRVLLLLWKKYMQYICVPLFLFFVLVVYLSNFLRQQTLRQNQTIVEQAVSSMEQRIENLGTASLKITSHPQILSMCRSSRENQSFYYNIYSAKKALEQYDNLMENGTMTLYCQNSRTELSTNSLCTDVEKYYGTLFQLGEMDWDSFQNYVQDEQISFEFAPVQAIRYGQKDVRTGLVYHYRTRQPGANANLFFLWDEDYIRGLFRTCTENGTEVYLLDRKGRVLFSTEESPLSEEVFAGEKPDLALLEKGNLVFLTDSSIGLQYLCVTTNQNVTRSMAGVQIALTAFSILAGILALLFAFLLARRNSGLLESVLKNQTKEGNITWTDLYKAIQEVVFRYERDNHKLQESVLESRHQLQREFFRKLLRKEFQRTHDSELYAQDAHIDLKASYYFLLIALDLNKTEIQMEDLEYLAQKNTELLKKLKEWGWVGQNSFVISLGIDRGAVLLPGKETFAPEQWMELLGQELPKDIKMSACGISQKIDVYLLPLAGACCNQVLNGIVLKENGKVILLDETEAVVPKTLPKIPQQRLNGLFTAVCAGDFLTAEEIFCSLFEAAVEGEGVAGFRRQEFFKRLWSILLLASTDTEQSLLDEEPYFEELSFGATAFYLFHSLIRQLCSQKREILERQTVSDGQREFQQKVMAYLEKNLSNPELSLTSTARECGFSPTYFSALFKEYLGKTFSSYIEEQRMQMAKKRLISSKETIEEIALACGYQNSNTFRRGYKKFFGVTPSQTRSVGAALGPSDEAM